MAEIKFNNEELEKFLREKMASYGVTVNGVRFDADGATVDAVFPPKMSIIGAPNQGVRLDRYESGIRLCGNNLPLVMGT